MPSISEGSDGLQPVRLFNRGAIEEKGEGARLVRTNSSLFDFPLSCATVTNFCL